MLYMHWLAVLAPSSLCDKSLHGFHWAPNTTPTRRGRLWWPRMQVHNTQDFARLMVAGEPATLHAACMCKLQRRSLRPGGASVERCLETRAREAWQEEAWLQREYALKETEDCGVATTICAIIDSVEPLHTCLGPGTTQYRTNVMPKLSLSNCQSEAFGWLRCSPTLTHLPQIFSRALPRTGPPGLILIDQRP
jgi:hypothetical protein